MSLEGSKTHENLKAAFAGESQANRRYLYFARAADIEGYTCANRGVVIVDSEGTIKYRWVAEPNPGVEPNYDEIKDFIKNM